MGGQDQEIFEVPLEGDGSKGICQRLSKKSHDYREEFLSYVKSPPFRPGNELPVDLLSQAGRGGVQEKRKKRGLIGPVNIRRPLYPISSGTTGCFFVFYEDLTPIRRGVGGCHQAFNVLFF